MADQDNEGVAYLRALRGTVSPHGPGAATAAATAPEHIPASAGEAKPGESQAFAGPDKRRSPRYKCEGSAEMREEAHDVRTWASFKDVSLHGCYVEAMATYPVGTVLHLKLEANGFQVDAKGTVRVTYPLLGMGIALTEIADEDRERLKEMLRTMSRPSIVMGPPASAPGAQEAAPLITDPTAALRALVDFFDKRSMLPREEFLRILRTAQNASAKPKP
jgi:hypothetical protein